MSAINWRVALMEDCGCWLWPSPGEDGGTGGLPPERLRSLVGWLEF